MMKKYSLVVVIIIFVLFVIPGGYILLTPDKEFSEHENRYLAKKPEVNIDSILEGRTQDEMTEYITDQFPLRDEFMMLATKSKKLVGIKDIGGVYLGKNGHYFQRTLQSDINEAQFEKNINAVKKLFDKCNEYASSTVDIVARVLLVPNPGTVMKDSLPNGAIMFDDEELLKIGREALGSAFVEVKDSFIDEIKNGENELYFKTDHHWTTYGAYLAYKALVEDEGREAKSIDEFGLKEISNSFLGTLYSKTIDSDAIPDSLVIPSLIPNMTVYGAACSETEEIDTIYDYSAVNKKDVYTIYFGGNTGVVSIDTDIDNGRNLLVVKDSFANSLAPYLTNEYDRIVLIDPRYFSGNLSEIVETNEINEVLVLYELGGFAQDMNLDRMMLLQR